VDSIQKIINDNKSIWFSFYLNKHYLIDRISYEFEFHYPEKYCSKSEDVNGCEYVLECYKNFGNPDETDSIFMNAVLKNSTNGDLLLRFTNWQIIILMSSGLNEIACEHRLF